MIDSWPFSAPACPPETGASTKLSPLGGRRRELAVTSADTVV
jgi:hypothetical protein